jgi:ADP-ribose pyrophosphatase
MKKINEPELDAYFSLMESRPQLFADSPLLPLEKDPEVIRDFTARTGEKIGVLYRSRYNMLVTDLIRPQNGEPYVYERIIPTGPEGVVVVAVYQGQFLLLRQFRHAFRQFQYAFVRGCGEEGLSPEENAAKEIMEEAGAGVLDCRFLGETAADSGLTAGTARVYLCQISRPSIQTGYEGIREMVLLEQEELDRWIAGGKITDSFTLAAYSLCCASWKEGSPGSSPL